MAFSTYKLRSKHVDTAIHKISIMKNSSLKYIPRLFAFYLLLFTFLSCNGQVMIDNPTDEPDDEENAMTYLALGDSYTIGESVSIAER